MSKKNAIKTREKHIKELKKSLKKVETENAKALLKKLIKCIKQQIKEIE